MKKIVTFNESDYKKIKDYAIKYLEGNVSMAIRALVKKGLKNDS